jgi:hypothetical protein
MEDSKMPQDPSKGKKAAPPPKGSNKPMAARQPRPTELTAKTQDYVPDKYTPPKKDTFSFTRQQTGEKTVKSPGNGPNLSSNTSRRMQFEGGLAAEYVGAARANAARVKKETPNSLVSAEYRAQLTKDLAAGKKQATTGADRRAVQDNTQRLANQAKVMRARMDQRKPAGATMDLKDTRGRTQTKQGPPPPRSVSTSGAVTRRPPSSGASGAGGGSGSGGAGSARRGRGVAGAAIAAAGVVGAMAGRMSKRGDETAAYNKGKADGRTFTPSGMRSSGQNVAQPSNTRPGVRDNMYASSNLRKIMMKGK